MKQAIFHDYDDVIMTTASEAKIDIINLICSDFILLHLLAKYTFKNFQHVIVIMLLNYGFFCLFCS